MGCGCGNRAKIRAQIEAKMKASENRDSKINSIVDEIRKKRLEALKKRNG